MEHEQSGVELPEVLTEKIIAMMPFPQIFKAPCLSKAWRDRFAPIASLDDEAKKAQAVGFQKEVARWCSKWATYVPLFQIKNSDFAYSSAARDWSAMPSLPIVDPSPTAEPRIQLEGALLYGYGKKGLDYEMFVENILNRHARRLPSRPRENTTTVLCFKLITDELSGTYKVILACRDNFPDGQFFGYSGQIYNSKTGIWFSRKLRVTCKWLKVHGYELETDTADSFSTHTGCLKRLAELEYFTTQNDWESAWGMGDSMGDQCDTYTTAYVNGVFYFAEVDTPWYVLAFNPEEGKAEAMAIGTAVELSEWSEDIDYKHHLTVCRGELYMILTTPGGLFDKISVLKIDVRSSRFTQVTEYDGLVLSTETLSKPVSYGNRIFIRTDHHWQILAFDLDKKQWLRFPHPWAGKVPFNEISHLLLSWRRPLLFQPGLNPFMSA